MTLDTLYNIAGCFRNRAELGIQSYGGGIWIKIYNKDGEYVLLEIEFCRLWFWILNKDKWDEAELEKVIDIAKQENIEVKGV